MQSEGGGIVVGSQFDLSVQLDVTVVVVTPGGSVLRGGTTMAVQVPTVQSGGGGIVVGMQSDVVPMQLDVTVVVVTPGGSLL